MENEEQKTEQQQSDEWNQASAEASAALMDDSHRDEPQPQGTAEMVGRYESLLIQIKALQMKRDDSIKSFDEDIANYSKEAAVLLATIAQRMGLPLNGAEPSGYQAKSHHKQKPAFTGNIGGPRGGTTGNPKRACSACGRMVSNTGWYNHQQAHINRGETPGIAQPVGRVAGAPQVSRKINPETGQPFSQMMGDNTKLVCVQLMKRIQPCTGREFSKALGKPDASAYLSGLKERGLAKNDLETHQWTLTEKGARLATA